MPFNRTNELVPFNRTNELVPFNRTNELVPCWGHGGEGLVSALIRGDLGAISDLVGGGLEPHQQVGAVMLSGVGLGDVQRMQDAAHAAKERQYEQELATARLQGPQALAEAQAQIGMQREQDRFQRMMEGQELRRSMWQRGFTSAGGTPLAMGTGETGFASALIGGDQGRINDILQSAHRESMKPLQQLTDRLGALRKPDTGDLREQVIGAMRERDGELLKAIVEAVRAS